MLAGGIAHDFNNILSPILGYTDIALDQLEENHPARDDLRQVLNAAERARELVQQILIFARGGEQERYPVQLHLVVQEVLKLIRASLPTTVEISQRVDARNDVVMADAGQMHQVIMNLCTNAAYAMRANGGVMRIELERREITPANVSSHPTITPGHYVVLTVQDHGVGMPAEVRSRVFEPFFTTKPSGEGTGLGLSVVHGIVHSHGGAVLVDSKPGAGSTFSVYLPAVADTRHNSEAENNAGAMGRGEHVLVVDDEPEIARMLRRMLESKGFRVTAFVSGDLALDAFRKAPGDFDAVLTDQTMPRMTGLVLARAVGSLRPDIPVILATGYSKKRPGEENWPENLEVVTKPFDATTLTALLRRLLDAGRPSGT
jgi:CheY-like chemotaxis protein